MDIGLYQGYKRRNAHLDALKPPRYIEESPIPLANQTFSDVESEEMLRELHDYLLVKYRLLTRVIGARKLHHSRFFSMNMDYGHQHYIDNLQNQKHITARALENLEKRTGQVLFVQHEWFQWARERQDEEERSRDSEKKRIKKEAALFKRYWSKLKVRHEETREKEGLKRQDEFLEEAYRERMSLKEDEDAAWDPIDDVVEDERATYIEIINLFLMVRDETPSSDVQESDETAVSKNTAKKGKSQKQATTEAGDKLVVETKSQMRKRLKDGTLYPQGAGVVIRGTPNNPIELANKTPSLPDDAIDILLEEVSEIKHLLFCRLLLSHARLLPVAVRADSVEELLNDADVKDAELRDLCLMMESPGPQDVRDACADLLRNEDEDKEIEVYRGKLQEADASKKNARLFMRPYGRHDLGSWMPKPIKKSQKQESSRKDVLGKTVGPTEVPDIDFRVVDD